MKKRHKIISLVIMISVICSVCSVYTKKAEAKSSLSSGSYYFNNSGTGHFLGRTSATGSAVVTSMNGILSSIATAANKAGANASIGFTKSIECSYANKWTCSYAYNIANYKTVLDSCYNALHDGNYLLYKTAKLDSYKILGNGSMSL